MIVLRPDDGLMPRAPAADASPRSRGRQPSKGRLRQGADHARPPRLPSLS